MAEQDPFVPMFAILVIMLVSLLILVACCWRVCLQRTKQRADMKRRQRALKELERLSGARVRRGLSRTSILQTQLNTLKRDCIVLLDNAIHLEMDLNEFMTKVNSQGDGQDKSEWIGVLNMLERSVFRSNFVVFAFVQMLHEESPLVQEVVTHGTESHNTSFDTVSSTQEQARLGETLNKLSHRRNDLNVVVANSQHLFDKIRHMEPEALKKNSAELRKSISKTMQKLADIASSGVITSPDPERSLSNILKRGSGGENWGVKSQKFKDLRTRAENCRKPFEAQIQGNALLNKSKSTKIKTVWFPLVRQYPLFFGLYWIFIVAIFVSWLARINQGSAPLQPETIGLGGFGVTFFGVPPQYDLDGNTRQAIGVPFIYGFMHCALFSLGVLPITMTRGFVRDLSRVWPGMSRFIPIEHFVSLHINLGLFILALLACGATVWLIIMLPDCLDGGRDSDPCLAFAPEVPDPANPVQNVMTLRFIVWSFWFPFLPLLYWAKWPAPRWFPSCCSFLRVYWFEFAFYSHLVVAYGILILALIARFDVFWPMLLSWTFYFIDRLRETFWRPKRIVLSYEDRAIYSRPNGPPTSMHLVWNLRPCEDCNCKAGAPRFPVDAGQWVYILIPAIDWNWHPFSISSERTDSKIELHIGVRTTNGPEDWTQQGLRYEQQDPTWTYKLLKLVQDHKPQDELTGFVRGPYGTTFGSCYNPKFGGAIVIGAGTGITAAESVLRENIRRRKIHGASSVPRRFWFVWSCRSASDISWFFDRVLELLVTACEDDVLNPNTIQTNVDKLDWLGVTIYVTRATDEGLQKFRSYCRAELDRQDPGNTDDPDREIFVTHTIGNGGTAATQKRGVDTRLILKKKIQKWLLGCIYQGSLDLPSTHIGRYLETCWVDLAATGVEEKGLAVGYCGPPALATTLAKAVQALEPGQFSVEFSADHQ